MEMLNARDHAHLRMVAAARGSAPFVQIVAAEFGAVAARLPVLLTKNARTGQFYAGAMLGFKPGDAIAADAESLGDLALLEWQRAGFFVAGEGIAIDRDHERFAPDHGEPLFDLDGEPAESLRAVQGALGQLKTGLEETDAFIRRLIDHGLVEPLDIALRFDDGETIRLQGLYTVSLDALADLDDAAVLDLFRRGDLLLIHLMAGSLRQIGVMADRRNRRLAA